MFVETLSLGKCTFQQYSCSTSLLFYKKEDFNIYNTHLNT